MKPNNDQLAVLRRLQSDGQISDEEFEDLARGLMGTEPETAFDFGEDEEAEHSAGTTADAIQEDDAVDDDPITEGEHEPADRFLSPSFRENLSVNYLGIVLIASIALLVVGLTGAVSWWVSIFAILVLVTTLFDGWGKVTLAGAVAVAVIMLVGFVFSVGDIPEPEQTITATLPPEDPHPPIPGSLGIYMDQVVDSWNTVEGPPRINRGLTRHNEIGEYDTFIYRFGDWGRLAGAYDPENEAIYALLITGTFSAPDTDQLYLHLCYVLAPYSQDCIDSYHEEGLDGGTLGDFADVSHEAEWTVGDGTWRLQIDQNVMTIRVYGPDAA